MLPREDEVTILNMCPGINSIGIIDPAYNLFEGLFRFFELACTKDNCQLKRVLFFIWQFVGLHSMLQLLFNVFLHTEKRSTIL